MNITVVGGSRGTGALVAQQAAAAGHEVRTVSRSLGASIAGVEQVALDATDAVALQPAVRGADAVIVTVGARGRDRLPHRPHAAPRPAPLPRRRPDHRARRLLTPARGTSGAQHRARRASRRHGADATPRVHGPPRRTGPRPYVPA